MTTNDWKILSRVFIGLAIAGLTAWYTVASVLQQVHPLDAVNLGLIAIAVICIVLLFYPHLFSRIQAFEIAGVKVDLMETQQKQQQMQMRLKEFELILPILLPPTERKHLLNLASGDTKYVGNNNVRTELRRLRSVGLINNVPPIGSIKNDVPFDLGSVVYLTDLGKEWVDKLQQYEAEVKAEEDTKHS